MRALLARNRALLLFFGKMLAAYLVWYVVYDLYLLPHGGLDAWLSHRAAQAAGGLLTLLGFEPGVHGRIVWLAGTNGIEVADGCNGLSTIGLFLGFVVAYPGTWRRRLWFIPAGMLLIFVANVVRLAVMALSQAHFPALFDFLHSIGLTTLFYVVVFALWMLWAHLNADAPREADAAVTPDASAQPA